MKQAIYRIYTEDKNYTEVITEAEDMFQGFSVLRVHGHWHCVAEDGLVLEFIIEDSLENDHKVRALAHSIRLLNRQEALLIAKLEATVSLVS